MTILALSDKEIPTLWERNNEGRFPGVDVIISCGDLPADYLSLLATNFHGPLFCVPGNHDNFEKNYPDGCINLDGKVVEHGGYRFMGLGGCLRYKAGPHQYTQSEMNRRYIKTIPQILKNGKPDILVTHAAAEGLGDIPYSRVHEGFKVFTKIITKYKPILHIHGHVHLSYNGLMDRSIEYGSTQIINAYEKVSIKI